MEFNKKTGWSVRDTLCQIIEFTNFLLICNGPLLCFPLHFLVFVLPCSILILSLKQRLISPVQIPPNLLTSPKFLPRECLKLSLSPIPVYAIVPLVLCSIVDKVSSVNPLSGWVGCPSLMVLGVADLGG